MLDVRDVVLEDRGYIFLPDTLALPSNPLLTTPPHIASAFAVSSYLRKHPLAITDQKTRLPTPAIAHHDKLLAILRRRRNVGIVRPRACAGCAVHRSIASSRGASVAVAAVVEEGFAAVFAV